MIFLAASAALAGIWGAVRTRRSANEVARNATRAHAKHTVLNEHRTTIDTELVKPDPAPWVVFTTLALCDAVLQNDQREWLGLMREAEWI